MNIKERIENSIVLWLCSVFSAGAGLSWVISNNIIVAPKEEEINRLEGVISRQHEITKKNSGNFTEVDCWETLDEGVGNLDWICLDGDVVTNRHIFHNGRVATLPPAICRGQGVVEKTSAGLLIDISDTKCDNDFNWINKMRCLEPDNSTMTCFSTTHDKTKYVYKYMPNLKGI